MRNHKNHVQIIGRGKKHYLEFLRNLTPQVFLFAFVFIAGGKLDLRTIDFSNWLATSVFYVLFFAFCAATYCNCALLIERCYSDFGRWVDKVLSKAEETNRQGLSRLRFFIIAILKKRWVVVLEMILVFFFLQIALAIVVVAALPAASNILKGGCGV